MLKKLYATAAALFVAICFLLRQRRKQRRKALTNGDLLATLASPDADAAAKLDAMRLLANQLKDPILTPPGLPIQDFHSLTQDGGLPLLDVRSPGEFKSGHIPGAHNVPLFTNEQRAEVGTIYAQQGREAAMAAAIQLVSPKLPELLQEVARLVQGSACQSDQVAVYCFRGGMRSGSVAFMLRRSGFQTSVLAGGYKAHRGWVTRCWDRPLQLERGPDGEEDAEEETEGDGGYLGDDWKKLELLLPETPSPDPAEGAAAEADSEDDGIIIVEPIGKSPSGDCDSKAAPTLVGDKTQEQPLARLSKADKKKVNKARKKQVKSECKLQKQAEQKNGPQPLVYRRPRVTLRTPPKTTAGEWAALDPLEAMSRLRVCIVGGRTGVGKTKVLQTLESLGHPIVDLEGLANHMGSTFGWCGRGDAMCDYQPSTEHYGNLVAMAWRKAAIRKDVPQRQLQYRWVFIEDEGLMVGKCGLPATLFTMLRCAPLVVRVGVPMEARVELLLDEYTSAEAQGENPERWLADMLLSMDRLVKKLGGAHVEELKQWLRSKDYRPVVRALLAHYDHSYDLHATDRASNGTDQHRIVDVAQAMDIVDRIDTGGLAQAILEQVATHDREA